ncbi:hypothetical protein ABT336_00310 [Micromonospora sp. NPDC000207]|uniref:hypothetical protein n=1 Tax=Micromonospora sp. NPDC000207 TaxID=3154246 RepID=UPI003329413F
MRRSRIAAGLVLVALSVVGCGSGEDAAPGAAPAASSSLPTPVGDAVDPTGPAPVLEGDARSTARWPDGITARLAAVERVPNSWGVDVPASMALVRLRLEVGNEGEGPLPVVPESSHMSLFYGENRTEVDGPTGYSYDDPEEQERKGLSSDDPTRIVPGSKVIFTQTFELPVKELGLLTVTADPPTEEGIRDPYTFLNVEKTLTRAK